MNSYQSIFLSQQIVISHPWLTEMSWPPSSVTQNSFLEPIVYLFFIRADRLEQMKWCFYMVGWATIVQHTFHSRSTKRFQSFFSKEFISRWIFAYTCVVVESVHCSRPLHIIVLLRLLALNVCRTTACLSFFKYKEGNFSFFLQLGSYWHVLDILDLATPQASVDAR